MEHLARVRLRMDSRGHLAPSGRRGGVRSLAPDKRETPICLVQVTGQAPHPFDAQRIEAPPLRYAHPMTHTRPRTPSTSSDTATPTTAHQPRAERPRCGAHARSTGRPCEAPGIGRGGRCRRHGGASTGAVTAEGIARWREASARGLVAARAALAAKRAAKASADAHPTTPAGAPA